jgi:lipopolysaccharide transport system permease protein
MPRRRSATLQFNAIRLVGGLLPASLIEQIARQEAPGQKASDYGLPKNLRIQVAVDQGWSRARALWQEAKEFSSRGEGTPWRAWFSSRLLREVFGWEDLASCELRRIEEALYPISHQAFGGKVPVVLQLGFWLTPIVYLPSTLPESLQSALSLNPLAVLVKGYQDGLLFGKAPDALPLLMIAGGATALLALALLTFRRAGPEMVDVL